MGGQHIPISSGGFGDGAIVVQLDLTVAPEREKSINGKWLITSESRRRVPVPRHPRDSA
jgi:hypothetical protein